MRLSAIPLLLALAATTAADEVYILTRCAGASCSSQWAVWHSGFGYYTLDANEGCRDPLVPAMNSICFDWKNKRGHFYFDGQPKRCLREWSSTQVGGCDDGGNCSFQKWNEVGCDW